MKDLVIVDTDVLIDASRGSPDALGCLQQLARHGTAAVSAVTHMELLAGCQNKTDLRQLDSYIMQYQIVYLTEAMSSTAIDLLRRYRLSHGLLLPDAFIAATCLTLARPLVSKNQRDFHFIAGLNLLSYPQPFAA